MMSVFFLLYIAVFYTSLVPYLSCVYIYIVSCHICISTIAFLNMLPSIFFSLNVEDVGE